MTAIGLVVLLVAAGLTLDVIVENTKHLSPDPSVVGQTLSGVNIGGFFLAGVVVGVVGLLGLTLLLAGLKRTRSRAKERKELRRESDSTGSLVAERDRLAAELDAERARSAALPATAAPVYPAQPGATEV